MKGLNCTEETLNLRGEYFYRQDCYFYHLSEDCFSLERRIRRLPFEVNLAGKHYLCIKKMITLYLARHGQTEENIARISKDICRAR